MTSAHGTFTPPRRRTVLAAAAALIALAGVADACARPYAEGVDLTVINRETGQPLRVWRHHGARFVAGEPGARYSLRVANHTDGRVLLVMSVDGVNVLTGETAAWNQRGYVIDAGGAYDVTGWRKTDREVAAFAFAPLPQSYAARTGRPGDVGVIGMAVFRERAPIAVEAPVPAPPVMAPAWRDAPADHGFGPATRAAPLPPPAPLSLAAPPPKALPNALQEAAEAGRREEKLGTAHGAREWSVVSLTTFERATPWPQAVRQIQYDTRANLVAQGVIPAWPPADHPPRAFPSTPGGGFVPDPPAEP